MSYILDALKKAEAERERGAVPGLHAQPAALAEEDAAPAAATPIWIWAAMALLLGLAVALGWALVGRQASNKQDQVPWVAQGSTAPPLSEAPPAAVPPPGPGLRQDMSSAPPPTQEPPAQEPPPRAAAPAAPTTAPAVRAAPAAPNVRTQATAPTDPPASLPARPLQEQPRDHALLRQEARHTRPPPAPSPEPATPAGSFSGTATPPRPAVPVAPAAAERLYALHELPDSIRQGLPTLAIGGAMYSDNAASRMLIINSQVFHEGDRVAPGLTLEAIRLKSAVFAYRGYRYSVAY